MATQNLVSADISAELQNSVMSKLDGIITDLQHVFVSLLPEDKNEYLKVGNAMLPLLDIANNVVIQHPEILPGVFNKAEYTKDYNLAKSLVPIQSKIAELHAAVDAALYAVNSDLMVETLDIYAVAQLNQAKVPGLDVIYASMKEFFKKTKRTKAASSAETK